ncbi:MULTISPECIES: hypothetical protein [Pseudomonas]|uniref:Uncharacterized protein n=1 Tax=Pseudomonas quercus TaxID=2722792 RepID=A0ABX0YIR3_9PSED|nr:MULTISPECIES: hypothetical protein [Pseudomonas]MBF7144669.1 hypothetical protein [Pseudomonas sp. LY10J]NJP03207.1 hypothetical protein [Pseudomonas quercus]
MLRPIPTHLNAPSISTYGSNVSEFDQAEASDMPRRLTFTIANRNVDVTFDPLVATPNAAAQIAHVLNAEQRTNLTVRPAGTVNNPSQLITFETPSKSPTHGHPEDVLVLLHVSLNGQALRCELKNPRTHFPRFLGRFEQPRRVMTSSSNVPLNIANLRQQWLQQQNMIREAFDQQGLIKKDLVASPDQPFEYVDFFQDFHQRKPADMTRAGHLDKDEILRESEWIHGESFTKELFAGARGLGNNLTCNNLKWLGTPRHFTELGDYIVAEKLSRLDLSLDNLVAGDGSRKVVGGLRRIGNNFSAPSLQQLNLHYQEHFTEFGRQFKAPNLIGLSLRGATSFEKFPGDMRLPSLVTLDLIGAERFRGFPAGFLDHMPNLRSLELRGTAARYRDLPQHIRENRDIYIDIRPAGEGNGRIDGQQTTHQQSVHLSSSKSAQRIIAKAAGAKFPEEFERLSDYIMALPSVPVPDGLQARLDAPLGGLVQYVQALGKEHPHRQYFTAPVNAAKRGLSGAALTMDVKDPHSGISTKDYLTACWHVTRDPENRHEQVTDETAREKFVQALYEIQRGYNLKGTHDHLEDDGDPRDLAICNAGAFNKITNVMSEILRDAETIYITEDVIKLKAAALIKNVIGDKLADGELSLADFHEPDEDGEILCTAKTVAALKTDMLGSLYESLNLQDQTGLDEQRNKKRAEEFLDYQLATTDLANIITRSKGKGKASD